MAEIRVNATGGLKLYDADDSHYAQIVAGTITSNTDVLTLGHAAIIAGTSVDLNGNELILDADADTSITADTDDTIHIKISGADDFTFTANTFTAESGSTIAAQALTATTVTASGVLKTDDATEATSTTDGSLQTDGGLSVVKDVVMGDDLKLLSDAAVLSFGANSEITLTHVHDTGLLLQDSGGTPTLQLHDSNESIASDGSKVIITSGGTAFSLPTSDGSNGQALVTNGSAVLSFASAGGGDLSFGGDTFGENKTIGANDAYSLTLETNNAAAMVISAAGEITKPLQPCFAATTSATQTNMTKGSANTIVFGTEIFDLNGDFASNTFTAPVTGKYLLTARVTLAQLDHDSNFYAEFRITTSNRQQANNLSIQDIMEAQPELYPFEIAVVADMDASDTATVGYIESGPGASQTDVYNADNATDRKYHVFSGCLLA